MRRSPRRRTIASRWKASSSRFRRPSWICKSKSRRSKRSRTDCAKTCDKYSTAAGEWFNRGPVLDALYTGNIKLDQIWLPDMKINYNFSSVARYDRCIVCHRAIDKTAAGSATEPAYPAIPRSERDRIVQARRLRRKRRKLCRGFEQGRCAGFDLWHHPCAARAG